MYIEMTTFSIPTVIIDGILFALLVMGSWFIMSFVAITIYWFGTGRAPKEKK